MSPSPGRPYSADLEVHRALNGATYRRVLARHGFGSPFRRGDVTVIPGLVRHPFGRSTHARGYLTHVVRDVHLAWRRGRLVGVKARWRCGGGSMHFQLGDEPTSPICPVCTIHWPHRPARQESCA